MEPGEIQRLGYMLVHAGLPRGLYILGEGVGGYGDYGELPHIVKGAVAGGLVAVSHEYALSGQRSEGHAVQLLGGGCGFKAYGYGIGRTVDLDAAVHELHDVVDDSKTEIRGKPLGGWGGRIAIFISG